MKELLSKIYAECIEMYYNGITKFSHINSKGYWEFTVFKADGEIKYKTKNSKVHRLY